DTYGSVILAAAQMFFDRRLPRMGDAAMFARLEELGQQAAVLAFEPDASLWEFRGRMRVHTFSSAMCWAACDRLAKIAGILGLPSGLAIGARRRTGSAPLSSIRRGIQSRTLSSRV